MTQLRRRVSHWSTLDGKIAFISEEPKSWTVFDLGDFLDPCPVKKYALHQTQFDSLSKALAEIRQVYQWEGIPFNSSLQAEKISWQIKDTPYLVRKAAGCWRVEIFISDCILSNQERNLFFEEIATIRFPSRKEAVSTLCSWREERQL
jgi:hypothetical protein